MLKGPEAGKLVSELCQYFFCEGWEVHTYLAFFFFGSSIPSGSAAIAATASGFFTAGDSTIGKSRLVKPGVLSPTSAFHICCATLKSGKASSTSVNLYPALFLLYPTCKIAVLQPDISIK